MDDLDHKLVAALRHDGRAPIASLAALLGVSRATVKARLDRLLADGVILGFTAVLRADAVEADGVRAVMLVAVEGEAADRMVRALGGFPQISAVHTTNGRWDVVVEIRAASLEDFDQLLSRVRALRGVAATETSILLSRRK